MTRCGGTSMCRRRARELLELFGGAEGEEFEEFLTENFYDLHYAPLPGAKPFSFGF